MNSIYKVSPEIERMRLQRVWDFFQGWLPMSVLPMILPFSTNQQPLRERKSNIVLQFLVCWMNIHEISPIYKYTTTTPPSDLQSVFSWPFTYFFPFSLIVSGNREVFHYDAFCYRKGLWWCLYLLVLWWSWNIEMNRPVTWRGNPVWVVENFSPSCNRCFAAMARLASLLPYHYMHLSLNLLKN